MQLKPHEQITINGTVYRGGDEIPDEIFEDQNPKPLKEEKDGKPISSKFKNRSSKT